jgi:hypothetical protein
MGRRAAVGVVLGLGVAAVAGAAALRPIPQDPGYHRLADTRPLLGIPNGLNVLSNLPFVLVGAAGLGWLARGGRPAAFADPREARPYAVFFAGLVLTGLGSAWYHLAPGNDTLLWDRLPLAATVMAFFAAVIAERIDPGAGRLLLWPLVMLGIASVLSWHASEARGRGDLRLYGLVQVYPVVAIPALLALAPARYKGGGGVLAALALYLLAKLFEWGDARIFAGGRVVSGHTLKHVTAALAGLAILKMLMTRRLP